MSVHKNAVWLWLAASALRLAAQSPAPGVAAPTQPSEKSSSPAISIDEIPQRMQETSTIVRQAASNASPSPDVLEVERAFPGFASGIRALINQTRDTLKTQQSLGLIREFQGGWAIGRKRLDGWQTLLRTRSTAFQRDLLALKKQSDWWIAMAASDQASEVPVEMLGEISDLRRSIQSTQLTVVTRRNEVLSLQGKVSELEIELDRLNEELLAAARAERERLFRLDGPAIWHPAPTLQAKEQSPPVPSQNAGSTTEALRYYLVSLITVLVTQAVLLLAFLLATLFFRKKLSLYPDGNRSSASITGAVLRRPFSLSILLSVLTGSILQPYAPQFLVNFGWLLMLIPLVRIIGILLPASLKWIVWAFTGIYLTNAFTGFLPSYARSTRALALFLALAGIGGLYWLGRYVQQELSLSGWRKPILWTTGILIGLLTAAVLGEVIGAIGLARLLTGGVLRVIYAALILYGLFVFTGSSIRFVFSAPNAANTPERDANGILQRWLLVALDWLVAIIFAILALRAFLLREPLLELVGKILNHNFSIGAIDFTLGSILIFLLVVTGAMLFSRLLRFFLTPRLYRRIDIARGTGAAISKLLHYAILTLGFFLAMGAAGIQLNKFAILAGGIGVGVGFGMQNIVNNFVSGLILLFERPVQVGDMVTVGQTSGEVTNIGFRASIVKTSEGSDVVIPNANLVSENFTNWTHSDERRRGEVSVGVAYGTDPEIVIRMLTDIAATHPKVLRNPAPSAFFTSFGESSLDFVLRYWTLVDCYPNVNSDVHIMVCQKFAQEGIEIPFPQRDLNLKNLDPMAAQSLQKANDKLELPLGAGNGDQ